MSVMVSYLAFEPSSYSITSEAIRSSLDYTQLKISLNIPLGVL